MHSSTKNTAEASILFTVVPWLVVSSLALLPVGRLAEIPLAILALIGLKVLFEKTRNAAWDKSTRYFSLFFLCLWIPVLISVPDSYNVAKTSSLAIEYLRFFLSGLAILKYCLNSDRLKFINKYCLIIVSLWIFYGLIHFFLKTDIAGNVPLPQLLAEVLDARFKLATALSVYSSFIFFSIYNNKHLLLSHILNFLCVIVLLLAGSRAAWIMYGVVITCFTLHKMHGNLKQFARSMIVLAMCFLAGGTVLYFTSEIFSQRMTQTLEIFKGDKESIDRAISLRLCIWKTAFSMIDAHPINGVGARAFRYAYPDYAEADDFFLRGDFSDPNRKIGAYHSHQMQLEVLSETGMFGGFFFLGAMMLLFWYWCSRSEFQKMSMLPYTLGLAAIFFPLNTHLALYSSSWAQVIYWFVALYFAAGAAQAPHIEPTVQSKP